LQFSINSRAPKWSQSTQLIPPTPKYGIIINKSDDFNPLRRKVKKEKPV
jgi:hypothetical protein